jgi:hypothetical protein
MSALGHKRTNRSGPKSTDVRYCPEADKGGCADSARPDSISRKLGYIYVQLIRSFIDDETFVTTMPLMTKD